MFRFLRIFALALVAASAVSGAGVYAQGLSNTVYVGQNIQLPVPVTASVGGRCEFRTGGAPQGSYDAGQIDTTAWQNDFAFSIECNTASRVAVVSTNGGLKNATAALDSGYVNLAPYTVALNLQGNAATTTASCTADTLLAASSSACSFRGPASTTMGLRLTGPSVNQTGSFLRVSAPAYPPASALIAGNTLVSGNYADTLTITIAAAP